jgi:hypothetical protein
MNPPDRARKLRESLTDAAALAALDADRRGEGARERLVDALEPVAAEIVLERTKGSAVDVGEVLEAS